MNQSVLPGRSGFCWHPCLLLMAGWLHEVSTHATPGQLITEWCYPKIISATEKVLYRAADRNMMSLGLLELGYRLQSDSWYNRSNRWNTLNLLTWGSVRKIYLRSMSLREDFQFSSFFLINVKRCRSHLFQSELMSVSDIKSCASPGWHRDTSAGSSLRPFPCFTKGMCQVTKVKLNSLSSQFW